MRTFLAIVITVVLFLALKGYVNGMPFVYVVIIMTVVMFPIFLIGGIANRRDKEKVQQGKNVDFQRKMDDAFAAIPDDEIEEANEGTVRAARDEVKRTSSRKDVILYLRPFISEGVLTVQNPRRDGWKAGFIPFYRFVVQGRVSLDDALAYVLRRFGELVAIGNPGQLVGASRVRVGDDNWKVYFKILAESSKFIIVFPGLREGSLWELTMIRRRPELLSKTIFIFPPEGINDLYSVVPSTKEVMAAMESHRFPIPGELNAGDGLVLDASGKAKMRLNVYKPGFGEYWIDPNALKRCATSALGSG